MRGRNYLKTTLLLASLSGLLVLAGSAFGTRGMTIALVFAALMNMGAYFWSDKLALAAARARPVSEAEAPELYRIVRRIADSAGIPMPRIHVTPSPQPNAFATGRNPRHAAVAVTQGLLQILDERELEAVLAHELTHIRNGDVRTMVVAVVIVGIMSFVGEWIFRLFGDRKSTSKKKDSGGGALQLLAFACIAAAWIFSVAIRFALSRRREYLADAGSVELTRNPDAMISALRKIDGKGELEGVPSAVMELCLDNPRSGFADLFATHPSIEDRIEALKRYAGGRETSLPQAEPSQEQPIRQAPAA
jgi:heat shock protein HtpX